MPEHGHVEHEIRKALRENETTAAVDIKVKFVNGVVFLDGVVQTGVLKEAVAEVARKVEGVTLVHNRLQINPEHHTSREQFEEEPRQR
jgi:osmotically-inducible protein OsmY